MGMLSKTTTIVVVAVVLVPVQGKVHFSRAITNFNC